MSVIVDGAFLLSEQRQIFSRLADRLDVPFRIIDCHAEHSLLQQRIAERLKYGGDASEATKDVLTHQQENHQALTKEELALSFKIDSTEAMSFKTATDYIHALIEGHDAPDNFPETDQ